MALSPGIHLGSYEVLAPLGAGGMGEVYRARDTRLGREVAIKILPSHLSSDSGARLRFEREAKTVSGLNHPNICTLHDIGHQDGVDFIVMEYIEGETLDQRIAKGRMPLADILKYGAQIADALDKAHRSGVIHRDLKPGNIMLTKSGAKLLDFGLAKSSTSLATMATVAGSTPSSPLTQEGMIVGTFQYMSPEQVAGQELDSRSDIFSFGAVLYEMVTGQKAFPGKSQLSVASAIVEKDPEPAMVIAPLTPANLDHAIRRCLAKNRDERWQTALDLGSELKWIRESGSQPGVPAIQSDAARRQRWLTIFPWALSCVLVAGLVAGAISWRAQKNARQLAYFSAVLSFPALDIEMAPDGHTLAVVGFSAADRTNVLWIYEIGGEQARKLPETQGARFPFWSPDGKTIAFFADGKLKKMDIDGGPVQTICDAASGRGGTWNRDGVIVLTPSGGLLDGLYRVPATGGTPARISTPDPSRGETTNRWPVFLPDGRHFLYFAGDVAGSVAASAEKNAIFVGALDSSEKTFVTKATGNMGYVAPGYLLFYRDKTLFAQSFDADKLKLSGEPTPLLTDVAYTPRISHTAFSASDGVLAAQRGSGVSVSKLVWYDRKGNQVGSVGEQEVVVNVALSPDGKTVGVDRTDEETQNSDVWTYDLQRNSMKRLTFDPSVDAAPVFSADGKQILFASSRERVFKVFVKDADGAQAEKLLPFNVSDSADRYPSDWSRDGRYILYTRATELWVAEAPDWRTHPLVQGQGTVKNAQFSPDEKWVAYASTESGKWEIYVTSFPDARGKWQISTAGGTQPRWRGDSKELFYLASDGKIMAVPITGGANFDAGSAAALFQAIPRVLVATSELVNYDVAKDGQRFLINTQMKSVDSQAIAIVQNWTAELKK
jgi:eukaryotic-like serine/threonine-protein kinase